MIFKKSKTKIVQMLLILIGAMIVIYTYYTDFNKKRSKIFSNEFKKEIIEISENQKETDIFFNIEYSGLDLAGNRYILKSKEAKAGNVNKELVSMKNVDAVFYFKDSTVLKIYSDFGIYNNKTLDMIFDKNVKAIYGESELMADKAEYSNSRAFLKILKNVQVKDVSGKIFADELYFDLKSKKLNIASFDDNEINANINIK